MVQRVRIQRTYPAYGDRSARRAANSEGIQDRCPDGLDPVSNFAGGLLRFRFTFIEVEGVRHGFDAFEYRIQLSHGRGGMGHGPNDLTSLDHFAEGFAVGIFTDEAWVENVPRVTR